jgi:Anti-sigma factor NepR
MLMGARSQLVLMKLGFDLRTYYEDLVTDPLPEDFQVLVERLS